MATPNPDYRENAGRAIYILGPINREMVHELTPKIIDLRSTSSDPITVYIDSPGGSITAAEAIRRLVKAPSQSGTECRMITVATGQAASAAADFLAFGDHALAYGHSRIVYHGVRQSATEVTYQDAVSLAESLQETDEGFALRLARQSFPRILWVVLQLVPEINGYREGKLGIKQLVAALEERFTIGNRQLLRDALAKQLVINDLSASLQKHLARFKTNLDNNRLEAEMVKAIINYRTRLHKSDGWLMSRGGLREVADDFKLLDDFYFGRQSRELTPFVSSYGSMFLSPTETEEYGKLAPEAQKAYIDEHASLKLKPLWYFFVSLCRLLQTKDFYFTPEEAYWAGVVDEVPGSDLYTMREAIEDLPQETPVSNPNTG